MSVSVKFLYYIIICLYVVLFKFGVLFKRFKFKIKKFEMIV